MHNDAGMTYAATMSGISQAKLYSIIFGKHAEDLAESIEFETEKIVAKDVHNPLRLKNKIDKQWRDRHMSCIEQRKYTILLEKITFKEAREYIEKIRKRFTMYLQAIRSSRTTM